MRAALRFVFLTFALASGARAQGTPPAVKEEPPVRVLRVGTLITDPSVAPIRGGVILLRGEEIVAAGAAGSVSVPKDAEAFDLGDLTVLPGLIDTHTHLDTGDLFGTGRLPSVPLGALRASRGIERALSVGVTTERVVGSGGFVDVALRDAINEGVIPGPRVVPAGHGLSIPGGHGDFVAFPPEMELRDAYTPVRGFFSSAAEAERAVQFQIKYGAEVIKVTASGGVGSPLDSPQQQQVSEEELRVIADMAHRMGRRATAHAENVSSIKSVVPAGFDSVDHGSELDDEAIRMMLERKTYLIPTVFVVDFINAEGARSGMPPYVLKKAKDLAATHIPSFKKALAAGVKIAAGSDMNYAQGRGTLIDEIKTEVKHGMTNQQALVSATRSAAECIGLEAELGTLAPGKKANLVAVKGNPLEDLRALDTPLLVMRNGRILVSGIKGVPAEWPVKPAAATRVTAPSQH